MTTAKLLESLITLKMAERGKYIVFLFVKNRFDLIIVFILGKKTMQYFL